jgi:hypothetical protein
MAKAAKNLTIFEEFRATMRKLVQVSKGGTGRKGNGAQRDEAGTKSRTENLNNNLGLMKSGGWGLLFGIGSEGRTVRKD